MGVAILNVFFYGRLEALQKKSYKVIEELVDTTEEDTYAFKDDNNHYYKIYPIVYETKDVYIISQLKKENGKVTVEYNFQKIINKNDVATYHKSQMCLR